MPARPLFLAFIGALVMAVFAPAPSEPPASAEGGAASSQPVAHQAAEGERPQLLARAGRKH